MQRDVAGANRYEAQTMRPRRKKYSYQIKSSRKVTMSITTHMHSSKSGKHILNSKLAISYCET